MGLCGSYTTISEACTLGEDHDDHDDHGHPLPHGSLINKMYLTNPSADIPVLWCSTRLLFDDKQRPGTLSPLPFVS